LLIKTNKQRATSYTYNNANKRNA